MTYIESKNKELIGIINMEGFEIDWHETDNKCAKEDIARQEELYRLFQDNPFQQLLNMGFDAYLEAMTASIQFLGMIAATFIKMLTKIPEIETLREETVVQLEEKELEYIMNHIPYMNGADHVNDQWIQEIYRKLNQIFSNEIVAFEGSVEDYFTSKSLTIHTMGRVFFHLVESKKDDYPFAFLATYSTEAIKDKKSKHLPLKNALEEYKDDNEKLLQLLATVNRASNKSELIRELVESGDIFHPIGITTEEAFTFLKEVNLYEEAGILCRIPNWWRKKSNALKLSITVGDKKTSKVGFQSLVDFNAELSLGGERITAEELKEIIAQSEGLALIKGKWVEVDREKLKETLEAYEKAQKMMGTTGLSIVDAMRFQLNASKTLDMEGDIDLEITNGEWMKTVIHKISQPDIMEDITCGDNFKATLREYQKKGLSWLSYMKALGLGACLADDMGLGKTIQVIALLNNRRLRKEEKTLLIVPATLIGNWVNEILKFAPSLSYYVLHPSENKLSEDNKNKNVLEKYDVVMTTYGMLVKYDWLKEQVWDNIILDEAQAIKNPGTKQTKEVKKLKANYRIAMTGTPIENRLSDLWSLFDFLNKGLLGSGKEFSNFIKTLNKEQGGYEKLKKVVSPFIIRRLKTDRSIIGDLPDKIEMKTFSTLTKKQAALYQSLVNDLRVKLESTDEGIQRKGLVLSSIIKFKQICNHPDQYLGQENYNENESGKYKRLREICETIYEKRERVLVFTQFKGMTEHLKNYLEAIFHHEGLVLHGETAVKKRKDIVDRFQGEDYVPFLVLSIKAGGVGLNLTKANHVIHFDRWWNPAVENQATDRAFRIGQKKNVVVHKFITKGTIEEKIDGMIEEKLSLQKEIVTDGGGNWITNMDDEELVELFTLSI